MKKILFIGIALMVLGAALLFMSCEDKPYAPNPHRMELDNTSEYYDQNYRVYSLEGCEYIVVGAGKQQWGSHKGNCKNPIHQNK